MKKLLGLLLIALFLSWGAVRADAAATEGVCGKDLTWKVKQITDYPFPTYDLYITGSGNMYDYSPDNQPWADYSGGIKSVTFSEGITSIGSYAFERCPCISQLNLPKSLDRIGEGAFTYCIGLHMVTLNSHLTDIGTDAFFACSGLRKIYAASLDQWLNIPGDSDLFLHTRGILYIGGKEVVDLVIPGTVASVRSYAFANCMLLKSVTLNSGVVTLCEGAFSGCPILVDVTIPATLQELGDYVFSDCTGLSRLRLPDGLRTLGGAAFSRCTSLSGIYLPPSLETIGPSAFRECAGLVAIHIPQKVTVIPLMAFLRCTKLYTVTAPGVKTIEEAAFQGCIQLKNLTLPVCLQEIGENAFDDAGPDSLNYEGTEEDRLGIAIAQSSGLEQVEWIYAPDLVPDTAYGDCGPNLTWALKDHTLTISGTGPMDNWTSGSTLRWATKLPQIHTVVLGENVTSIGENAFEGCWNLTTVQLGRSLTTVGEYAFYGCTGLSSVIYSGPENKVVTLTIRQGNNALKDAPWNCTGIAGGNCGENSTWILYGDGTLVIQGYGLMYNSSSKDAVPWSSYAGRIRKAVLDEGINSIGRYHFSDCVNLEEIVLPDTITSIENYAFQNCSSLKTIRLPEKITTIGSSAFYNCSSLETIRIPNTVTELSGYVFRGCTNLESVAFGSSIRSIGDQAFAACKKLSFVYYNGTLAQKNSITISPVGNTPLNSAVWLYADQGAVFTLPADLAEIQSGAFLGTNAEVIIIPASCSYVSADAFQNCPRLKYIINRADISIVPPTGVAVIAD